MRKLILVLALGVQACTTTPTSQFPQPYSSGLSSSGGASVSGSYSAEKIEGFDEEDLTWYYKTVYGEVRQQRDHEVEAVCQVIYNRLESGLWGSTFKEVVLAPKQFSVWNHRGGQRRYLLSNNVIYDTDYHRVKSICISVVKQRLSGVDTSRGLNYFYHPQSMEPSCVKYKKFKRHHKSRFKKHSTYRVVCTRWRKLPPRWAYNYHHRERIGAGVFFRKAD